MKKEFKEKKYWEREQSRLRESEYELREEERRGEREKERKWEHKRRRKVHTVMPQIERSALYYFLYNKYISM